jgi:Putative metal-binding motif
MRSTILSTIILISLAACGGDAGNGGGASPDAACATHTYYPDHDGDGYGDSGQGVAACAAPAGFVDKGGDCKDDDLARHPGAAEICNGADDNCDGNVDDADPAVDTTEGSHVYYRDSDGDGFGDAGQFRRACAKPAGYVANATDCDDGVKAVNPSAQELCDGLDNDCDALVDVDDPSLDASSAHAYYHDGDHDGVGAGAATVACSPPVDFVATSGDCDDNDASSHPGGTEVCDGADNDCDGGKDGTAAKPNQCAALVGTYAGSYAHDTVEKVGSSIINEMKCSGTGNGSLVLGRTPALQGTFSCVYAGGLALFEKTQTVTLAASVGLDGKVTGTVDHVYNGLDDLDRTYNVSGTLAAGKLTLAGTGSWLPNPMSAVPWEVTFSFAASK